MGTTERGTADNTEETASENDDLHPEPLDIDLEDVEEALPHGKNPHPPSESDVQVPG